MSYSYHFEPGSPGHDQTLVLLHGTGGDEHSFLPLGQAVDRHATILSIRGNVSEGGMNRYFRRLAEGVYDMADLAARTKALSAFITEALARHGRNPALATGIGYSNGANILANMLFTEEDSLRRAVLMHPLIPFTPAPRAGLSGARVLVTAGTHDPISPVAMTDALEAWLGAQGVTVDGFRHAGGHEIANAEVSAIAAWLVALDTRAAA